MASSRFRFEELPIPAPNVQNHAANLCELSNGDLLCVWFSGTQEGMADISVYMSRLPIAGGAWSAPIKLSDDPERSEQNPVLFEAPDGRLWLMWTSQRAGNQDTAVVMHRISSDSGHTWTKPSVLIDRPGTFVRQPVIVNKAGEWLLPLFRCRQIPGQKWVGDADYSAVAISRDSGATWAIKPLPGSLGCVHMNIVPMDDGSMLAFFRSRWADFIYRSRSVDGGHNWEPPKPTTLPNNNASVQCVRLRDGQLAIVFNRSSAAAATQRRESLYDEIEDDEAAAQAPAPGFDTEGHEGAPPPDERKAFWGAPRAPLSLAFSSDGGLSWPESMDLEVGDGFCLTNNSKDAMNREFSYPSIIQGSDSRIHVAYTYFRQRIKYLRSDPVMPAGTQALPEDDRASR